MFSALVSCKLKKFEVTAEIRKSVIGLGIPEAGFQIWNSRKTPRNTVFTWEL